MITRVQVVYVYLHARDLSVYWKQSLAESSRYLESTYLDLNLSD